MNYFNICLIALCLASFLVGIQVGVFIYGQFEDKSKAESEEE